jgi:hypothetical protein
MLLGSEVAFLANKRTDTARHSVQERSCFSIVTRWTTHGHKQLLPQLPEPCDHWEMNSWFLDEVAKQVLNVHLVHTRRSLQQVVEDSTVTAHIVLFGFMLRSMQKLSMKQT